VRKLENQDNYPTISFTQAERDNTDMIIDTELLDKVSAQAKESSRLRMRSVYRFACKEL